MPIKEFICTAGRARHNYKPYRFEMRFSSYGFYQLCVAEKQVRCPKCGLAHFVKPITHSKTAPPKFNGPGFYETDYKR